MINIYLHNLNSNKIVIPWSGGVDSTKILLDTIKYCKGNKEQTKDLFIDLVCIINL